MGTKTSDVHYTEDLIPELRERFKSILSELSSIDNSMDLLTDRKGALRIEALRILQVVGVESIDDREMNMRASVQTRVTKSLSRERLLELGISAEILSKATQIKESEPFLTVKILKEKK